MRPAEVAESVFRLGTKWVNFYLLVDQGEATLIDAGYPNYWSQVTKGLAALGLAPGAVSAVIVTHHHIDHVGTAEQCRRETGATVYVHEADAAIVGGERRSHVPPGFYRQSWRASMARYLAHTVAAGGARYRAVAQVEVLSDETVLDAPGRPRIIPTPGHTAATAPSMSRITACCSPPTPWSTSTTPPERSGCASIASTRTAHKRLHRSPD